MKEPENWYWEVEDVGNALIGKLHFKEFYDDEIILEWQLNNGDVDDFHYKSTFLNVKEDILFAKNPDDAMSEFIDRIEQHIEWEIDRHKDQLETFKKLKD